MTSIIPRPVVAAIAVVIKDNSVLLVRRANPPDAGFWGLPGGKIEFGERIEEAVVRELFEETGIRAASGPIFTAVDAFDYDDGGEMQEHYILIAVLCRWISGAPMAGDDALEAAWHNVVDLDGANLVMSFGVSDVVRQAVVLHSVT